MQGTQTAPSSDEGDQATVEEIQEQNSAASSKIGQSAAEEIQEERKISINEMRGLVGLDPVEEHSEEIEIPSESNVAEDESLTDEGDFVEEDESLIDKGGSVEEESLIDEGDFVEEEDLATKRKLWQGGWPKVGVVAIPLGVVCLLLALILGALAGMKLAETEETTDDITVVESTDEIPVQQQQEAEIARLKTSNALGNQASILDSQPTRRTEIRPTAQPANASVRDAAQQPKQTAQRPTVQPQQPTARPQPQQPTPRARPVAVSRAPVTPAPRQPVRRATAPAQAVRPAPAQAVRPAFVQTQPLQAQPVSRQTPVDPFAQWEKLAAVGSYGQVNGSISSALNSSSEGQPAEQVESPGSKTIPVLVGTVGAQQNVRPSQAEITTQNSRPRPRVMQDSDRREDEIAGKYNRQNERATAEKSAYKQPQPIQSKAIDIESLEIKPTAPQGQEISYWVGQSEAADIESFEIAQAVEVAPQDSYEAGVSYIMRNAQPEPTRKETVILPGINAKGEVVTPVAWAQDIPSTAGSIELTEDLVSNGSVIMPAGTQLTVALNQMSASGMMQLTVTSILLPESGYEHMQIPAEAITIQGAGGQILMAKDISGVDGELRRLDRNQAILGALGTVGSVLNRPSSSVNTVGVGGAGNSATYGSPNIVGAILEGSANTMIAQRAARNQQRATELQARPAVWVLEQGTEIEVFISKAVNIGE